MTFVDKIKDQECKKQIFHLTLNMCRQEGSSRFAVNIAESFERVICRDLSCHTKDRFTIKFQQRKAVQFHLVAAAVNHLFMLLF